MSDQDLGLRALTDDQLVELARAVGQEIAVRNPAVQDAASEALRQVIDRIKNDQNFAWARKKWLAAMVAEHLENPEGWRLHVETHRRITIAYLDTPWWSRQHRRTYTLHVTGSSQYPPGSLTASNRGYDRGHDEHIIRIILMEAVHLFPDDVIINCDQALKTNYQIPPFPPAYLKRMAEMDAEREARQAEYARRRNRLESET